MRGAQYHNFSKYLNKVDRGFWWLSGYIVSYSGAKALLKKIPVEGPVDSWLNTLFSELNVLSTKKSVVFQRNDLKSNNRYSILPLLSKIGIQSDKTHLLLQQKKGKSPLFCIGYSQKDRLKLELILNLLSYRCCHDLWGINNDAINEIIKKNKPLLFDAYIGLKSVSENINSLIKIYPSAIFILSCEFNSLNDVTIEQYNGTIVLLQKNKSNLNFYNVFQEKKWIKICKILGCKIPQINFPSTNNEITNINCAERNFEKLKIEKVNIDVDEHDITPWIIPYGRLSDFGITLDASFGYRLKRNPYPTFEDKFYKICEKNWDINNHTFPTNNCYFSKENLVLFEKGICKLYLRKQKFNEKKYTSASISSKKSYKNGRFEITIKPAQGNGIISAFFLHRNNPWQEIDLEFLGTKTRKLLTNVYFNPGENGVKYNYGNRGTPMIIDLDFDFSEDFHNYAIEWDLHEIRWFVDNRLLLVRRMWDPTPIPNLPMNLHCNIWSSISSELSGDLCDSELPLHSSIKRIKIYE